MNRDVLSCHAHKSLIAGVAALTALALAACLAGPAVADESSVARGEGIWKEKAGCQECHGWAGDGKGGFHHPGVALSLRVTQLTRDQILDDDTMRPAWNVDAAFRPIRLYRQTLL